MYYLPIQFFSASGFFNGTLALILGLLVFFRDRRNPVYKTFLLLNISIAVWSFGYWQWLLQTDYNSAIFWIRVLTVGSIFIPITFFQWVETMLGKQHRRKKLLFIGYLLTIFFVLISSSEYFVKTVNPAFYFPFWPKAGFLYTVFLGVSFIGFTFLSLWELFHAYKRSFGLVRLQLKLVLIGFTIGFLGGSTNFLLWYDIPFPPVGNIFVSAYPIIFSYAIIRHRFLDIKLALRGIIEKVVLSFLIIVIFLALIYVFKILFGLDYFPKLNVTLLAAATFFALVLPFLERSVRQLTNRFFFKKEYSQQELIRELGRTITRSIDPGSLMRNIREAVIQIMGVSFVGFVVLPKDKTQEETPFLELVVDGIDPAIKSILKNSSLWQKLKIDRQVIYLDEQKRLRAEQGELAPKVLDGLVSDFERTKSSVAIPLLTSEGIAGIIFVGEKKNGDAFTSSDFDIFEMLMFQSGIALENALLFERTRDFNSKLKMEVSRATAALAERNRRLQVLRRLDMIMMNTLDLYEMSQKIVDTVSWEMGYEGAMLCLLEDDGLTLSPYAVSDTPNLRAVLSMLPTNIRNYRLDTAKEKDNPMSRALSTRKPIPAELFSEMFKNLLDSERALSLQKISRIKHFVIYPLSSKGKALGVVVFGLSGKFENLEPTEKELLTSYMDVTGIAVENAQLYYQTRKSKEELEKAYERLKELDRMKDEFISITSHELRTPMSSIKGYLWMLRNKGGKLTESQQRYIEKAQRGSERMINLINDTLNISRIEQGRTEFKTAPFAIGPVISEVAEGFKLRVSEKNLYLKLELSENEFEVFADSDKVREIIGNLLENAVKFTEVGGITISVKRVGNFVKTTIGDTGKGIPPEDLPKLFLKFGRLEHSFATIAESSGTGLGLYICKLLSEKMGGSVGVTSKQGKGSEFYFTLPIPSINK